VNIPANPFSYTSKHEGVKRMLACTVYVVCRKGGDVAAAAAAGTSGTSSGSMAKKMSVGHK